MNRIQQVFQKNLQQGKKLFIPYITAGDPSKAATVAIMNELVAAGADIIELGMAFSDPVADGAVIQAAHLRALKQNFTLADLFQCAKEFRQHNQTTPIILFTYFNPIEIMGYEAFIAELVAAKIDGVLVVDLPFDEGEEFYSLLRVRQIDPIFLITPTTNPIRMQQIVNNASGFLYYVSLKGVTGATILDTDTLFAPIKQIKKLTAVPVVVGFGVQDGEMAAKVAAIADGVVIGSALVKIIADYQQMEVKVLAKIHEFCSEVRQSLDKLV